MEVKACRKVHRSTDREKAGLAVLISDSGRGDVIGDEEGSTARQELDSQEA